MYHNNYFHESGTVPVVYQNYLSLSSLSSINSTVLPFAKPTSISGNFTVVKLATNYIGNNCILFSNVAVTDDTPCWKFERFHIVKVQSEFSV